MGSLASCCKGGDDELDNRAMFGRNDFISAQKLNI